MTGNIEPTPAALAVDRELAEIEGCYEFLSLLQPTNVDAAWENFQSRKLEHAPSFEYQDIDVDCDGLRRRLDRVDMAGVDDASLLYFLSAKRHELDVELKLLQARNTDTFLAGSIELFGPVQQQDTHEATRTLQTLSPGDSPDLDDEMSTREVREMAEQELEHYRSQDSSFEGQLEERSDQEGFLASECKLIFPAEMSLPRQRARALVQHEIGVHIVTYHNGSKQPLRLLRSGLSSYDELQEAFGALAEHLVGGLTATRIRTLAGRVLAARLTEQQTHFVDVFRHLTREHGFSGAAAFRITARVHQSGGFTRDQIYLRGLCYLLRYLAAGGELEPLYIGKLGHSEVPMIHDLRRKGMLREPPLKPRFLEMDGAGDRLERIRGGVSLVDLAD